MANTQYNSFWHATAPTFVAASGEPQGHYDVAIIGAGFTGLGAARKLAKKGMGVAVLEAQSVGFGASGRNGGHLNNGLAHSFVEACASFGQETAIAMYRAFDDGIETIERIADEEKIECNFRRSGKLKLASKPKHMIEIRKNFDALNALVDPETTLLTRDELSEEIGSSAFHGAMLQPRSAMMHMGRFATGLAEAASRHGASIFETSPVIQCVPDAKGCRLTTPAGTITAQKVLLATGAYTTPNFHWFRRRIIPVGSFLIATRPLTDDEVRLTLPGNRTCVTTMNIGNYFRLSADNRMIFGGRARFSARSDQQSDAKAGKLLQAAMSHIFPHLAEIEIDYCWGGMVDMTSDRYPRTGEAGSMHYAMGYSGHGAQIATHLGEIMADQMTGVPRESPWSTLPWNAVPGHFGKPWFLPLVGAYYKILDKVR